MVTLRIRRKLAAVSRGKPENTGNNQSQNTILPVMAEKYITQVCEENEGRVTKKLFHEFSRTESRILGALSKLDEFLLNPQVRIHSVAVPRTSKNINSENQEPTGDRSLNNTCPKVMFSACHTSKLNDSEQGETRHMVTEVLEETAYCSLETPSGDQKKARSTSQPEVGSENTPAATEADQILMTPQQLATNSISANFNNNINKTSKLPNSLKTTMPTFDGKSEKFEIFQDLFQTSLKIHVQFTEEDKIKYFHSVMRGDALKTIKNITSLNGENLGEIATVFHKKCVKPQSVETQISTTGFQPSEPEPEFIQFFRRTPETCRKCNRSCHSRDHSANHICPPS